MFKTADFVVAQRRFITIQRMIQRNYGTPIEKSYVHGISTTPLLYNTIGELLRKQVEKRPDQKLFLFPQQSIIKTYVQFYEDVEKLAVGLVSLGLDKGDRVGMWGPNVYEWVVTQFATALADLVMVTINPSYKTSELEYCMQKVGIKCLIASNQFKKQDYYSMVSEICSTLNSTNPGHVQCENLPKLKIVAFLDDKQLPGCLTFNDIYQAGTKEGREKYHELTNAVQPDNPVNIQFTSGTTGSPKGVTLSHFNITNNAYFIGLRIGYHEKPHVICSPPPLYHCFGCVAGTLMTVIHGNTCIFPAPSFEPLAALQAVHEHKCTSLYGTPTMFIDMLNHDKLKNYDYSSLTTGIIGGAPCPIEVCKKLVSKMNMKDFFIVYGTTENSPATFQTVKSDEPLERAESVGKILDHIEAKIVDHKGNVVPLNTKGELYIRGHCVMLGYYNDIDKTNEAIGPDRWYRTGDLGVMNDKKYVKIVDRQKDMIDRGGENIFPSEIEQFLCKHPKVVDVHVIGVPDHRMGEEVCAWIRLHENETCTEAEIREHCNGKIAHFKIPRYIVFKEEKDFPITVTGKVQKYKMKEVAKQELNLGDVKSHFSE